MFQQQKEDRCYLIIGKTGDGKSELCRTLTGFKQIPVSDGTSTCTKHCQSYSSTEQKKELRGFNIKVIDTPGLDGRHEDIFTMIKQLNEILGKQKKINGIFYVCSITRSRDQSMESFKKFLEIFFTEDQLMKAFIPILTNFDGVCLLPQHKIDKLKQQKQKGLQKVYGQKIKQTWKNNNIQWINDVQFEQPLPRKMQQISDFQFQKLMQKTQNISINVEQNISNFCNKIIEKTIQKLSKQRQHYQKIEQQLQPMDIKMEISEIPLRKKFINILKFIFVNTCTTDQKLKPTEIYNLSQKEQMNDSINKLVQYNFWKNFSKRFVEINECKGVVHNSLKLDINRNQFESIIVKELACKKIPQNKNEIVKIVRFKQDAQIYLKKEGVYSFFDVKILRPCNEIFLKAFVDYVKN